MHIQMTDLFDFTRILTLLIVFGVESVHLSSLIPPLTPMQWFRGGMIESQS